MTLHRERYPEMMAQDAGKLFFQRHLGPGHLIADSSKAFAWLCDEWTRTRGSETEPVPLGDDYVRMPLSMLSSQYELRALHRMMLASAKAERSDRAALQAELEAVGAAGLVEGFGDWLAGYLDAGMPLVRHAESYRAAYEPAYRVILREYLPCLALCAGIEAVLEEKGRVTLAIDGHCGSGKSTLAKHLQSLYPCGIIYMDDFFLPPELRTAQRLDEVGGNVHYERFQEEVAAAMKAGADVSYRPFDCSVQALAPLRTVVAEPVMICEGSYSMHPALTDLYDLAVFSTCSPEVQRERILARSGPRMLERFVGEWIPMEERYFAVCQVPERCQFEICTG